MKTTIIDSITMLNVHKKFNSIFFVKTYETTTRYVIATVSVVMLNTLKTK